MTPQEFTYPITVLILYASGTSADMIDTLEAMESIKAVLEQSGHQVRCVEVNTKNWRKSVHAPGDVVINLVEDEGWILYRKVTKMLMYLGRATLAHNMPSVRFALDKMAVKRKLFLSGVRTPQFRVFTRKSTMATVRKMQYPFMVKPASEHAGIGISQDSVVIDQAELEERAEFLFQTHKGGVLVEEYIDGPEIHVTVLGNGRRVVALPAVQIQFTGEYADNWDIYTYNAKWQQESWEYWDARVQLADPRKEYVKLAEQEACKAFKSVDCCDIARVDLRVDLKTGLPYVLDVNMSPSLNRRDNQDATTASVESLGWSYDEFIETLLVLCYKRTYGRLPDRMRNRQFMLMGPVKG